jgi:CheY-like chemotaxis protein
MSLERAYPRVHSPIPISIRGSYVREHCRRAGPEPCLIILDLHLPRYDGSTVLRAIRSESELSGAAIPPATVSSRTLEGSCPCGFAEGRRIVARYLLGKPESRLASPIAMAEVMRMCMWFTVVTPDAICYSFTTKRVNQLRSIPVDAALDN